MPGANSRVGPDLTSSKTEPVRLLLTRPQPDAERTAAALRARGHDVLTMPLMRIEPIADADIGAGPWGAVIATSANACRVIAAHKNIAALRGLPLFAVGRRTAQAAEAAGFSAVISADGALDALAALVIGRITDKSLPLLYLAGADRAGDLAGALAARGLRVHTVVVYRAIMETQIPPTLYARLQAGEIDGVLHFSARSVQAFLAAVTAAGLLPRTLKIQHYCLSAQVAAPLAAAGAVDIRIAESPNERALVDMPGR